MSVHVLFFIFYATDNFCMEYVFLESVWYGIRPDSGSENGISTWRKEDINILSYVYGQCK
jgi:hypothetical protein